MRFSGVFDSATLANRRTTDYKLVPDDAFKLVEMNVNIANTGCNVTVQKNSLVAFEIGTKIHISWYGTSQPTIVPDTTVVLRSAGNCLKIAERYSIVTLIKVGTNEWYVVGNLTT